MKPDRDKKLDLSELIQDAFDSLKVLFKAEDILPPQVAIDQVQPGHLAYYDAEYNILCMKSDVRDVKRIGLNYLLGEEVGHYLHHQVNPKLFPLRREIQEKINAMPEGQGDVKAIEQMFHLRNFIEFIGSYSGLLYVEKTAGHSKALTVGAALLKTTTGELDRIAEVTEFDRNGMIKHNFGYMFGCFAFRLHGARYLASAARVDSIETIKQFLTPPIKWDILEPNKGVSEKDCGHTNNII